MSGGIWFATVGVNPGLEGVALLLPTKRLRGFVAFLVAVFEDGPAASDMSPSENESRGLDSEIPLRWERPESLSICKPDLKFQIPSHRSGAKVKEG